MAHEPLFTCEQAATIASKLEGAKVKNLFLTDRRGFFGLFTVLDNKRVNLKELKKNLHKSTLSFAKPEDLQKLLNITPGAVTPCALMNDVSKQVSFYLDQEMLQYEMVNVHPLRNDMTITLIMQDLIKFIKSTSHTVNLISIPIK